MNRRTISRTFFLLSFGTSALILASACGSKPKTPSEAIRPKDATGKEALGTGNADGGVGSANCSPSDDDHALIIDLPDNDRREIEDMVKNKKVPIVKYDCATLTILKRCNLEATYEYTAISLDEKVISMDNADSASANIPLGTAGGVKASVATGQKIDLALAQVGSKRTKLQLVERQTLKGDRPQDCEGASHYIYKIDVGAWALAQRSGAQVAAAAEVFTASAKGDSQSSKSSGKSVGKIENCKNASDKDTNAPDNCGTPISIDLRRIEEKAKEDANTGEAKGGGVGGTDGRIGNDTGKGGNATSNNASYVPPCPEGKVRSEAGSCVAPSANIKYICRGDDFDDCKGQCEKGVSESCIKQALFYSWGMPSKGATKVERDPPKAIEILKPVCEKSTNGRGCVELAQAYTAFQPGKPASDDDKKKANVALELGCKKSDPRACYSLGEFVGHPLLGVNDPEKSVFWWKRGCTLGDMMSCLAAGRTLIEGRKNLEGAEVVKKDPAAGTEILETSCKSNNFSACSMLSRYLTDGKQMKKDPKKAADLFKFLCNDKKSTFGCVELALLQLTGEGTEAKPAEARATLEKFCNEDKYSTACYGVGLLSEKGLAGAAANKDKALALFTQYKYTKDASLHAAQLLEATKGEPAKIADMYRNACFSLQEVAACKKSATFYEKNKDDSDDWQARSLFATACRLDPKDKASCAKAKAPPPKSTGKPGDKPTPPGKDAPTKPGDKKPPTAPPTKK